MTKAKKKAIRAERKEKLKQTAISLYVSLYKSGVDPDRIVSKVSDELGYSEFYLRHLFSVKQVQKDHNLCQTKN